jgi:hypothetical protein
MMLCGCGNGDFLKRWPEKADGASRRLIFTERQLRLRDHLVFGDYP